MKTQRLSPTALALVVLAHGGLAMGLLSMGVVSLPTQPTPLMVELLPMASLAPKVQAPVAPKAAPVLPKALPAPAESRAALRPVAPVLATQSSPAEPAFEVAKAEKAAPEPAAQSGLAVAQPGTSAHPAAATTGTAAPASMSAPAPTAPRFDAAYLDNPAPNYPPLSKRAREEGRVVLHVFVEHTGQAGKTEVQTSSGFERLDRSALAAVSRWKFVPAKQGAEAVAAWVLVPIVFSLKD